LIRLRKAARAKGFKTKDINQIPVEIRMQNATEYTRTATLDFVNTGLNAATGTMELRALLDNKDFLYVPGLFVQVRVAITKPSKQLTIPDTAVLYDQIGSYLLVVDTNNLVVLKRVELGGVEQGMRSVVKGLDAQDKVIIGGLQNATPGNKVDPHEQESEKTAK
jgi:multidrug efflux pump subunit AcrA (membrane-fusion protein)